MQDFDPETYLDKIALLPDAGIDLALAALALSACTHPGIKPGRYLHHLDVLARDVAEYYAGLMAAGEPENAQSQLTSLRHVLHEQHAYTGDVQTYDDLQNASLIRVIDRAKGLPITLSILYIHAARLQGWDIAGLNIPGHFVCRLDHGGQRLIFDPFENCKILSAADLRILVKKSEGPTAELSAKYYEPSSNREILIRLQNNIKYRQIDIEDYEGALETVEVMRRIDPGEYRLLLDAGVLYARTDQTRAAIGALGEYIDKAPNTHDRLEAELLLRELSDKMN